MEQEGIIEKYKKNIEESEHPGYYLAGLYAEMFNVTPEKKHIEIFSKLVRLYGRRMALRAVLDIASMETVDHTGNIIGLLTYFCNKHVFEEPVSRYDDLTSRLKELQALENKLKDKALKIKEKENN